MPQISLPSYSPSRTKTRTYDVKADPATVIAALLQLVAPTGSLVPTLSESEPGDGWKLCNGQSLLKFEYPDLFAAIGGTWGETSRTTALLTEPTSVRIAPALSDPAISLAIAP